MSSFCEPASAFAPSKFGPLVHYIAVDHEARAVVLTCRGTLGLQDLLTDLTADYEAVAGLEHADPAGQYFAHAGMLASARLLTARGGAVHECLRAQLEQWPEYGLVRLTRSTGLSMQVLAGHSLAGGATSLLAILSACPADAFDARGVPHPPIATPFVTSHASGLPPGRPIHAYAFGPPCCASIDLAN